MNGFGKVEGVSEICLLNDWHFPSYTTCRLAEYFPSIFPSPQLLCNKEFFHIMLASIYQKFKKLSLHQNSFCCAPWVNRFCLKLGNHPGLKLKENPQVLVLPQKFCLTFSKHCHLSAITITIPIDTQTQKHTHILVHIHIPLTTYLGFRGYVLNKHNTYVQ